MGRPTKLTDTVQAAICEALREGNYLSTSAALAGVSGGVVNEWIARGKGTHARGDPGGRYARFAEAVEHARAVGEARLVAIVQRGATGYDEETEETVVSDGPDGHSTTSRTKTVRRFNSADARWLLERGHTQRWGPSTKVEHTGHVEETRRIIVEIGGAGGGVLDSLSGPLAIGGVPPPSSAEDQDEPPVKF